MKSKTTILVTIIFLATSCVFSQDRPRFSLSLENSFVTGAIVMKDETPTDYAFDDNIVGGQSLLTFRYHLNDNFSVGVGSGVHINRLNGSVTIWGTSLFSVPMLYIPIYAEFRGTLPINDLISVYASSKIGGAFAPLKLDDNYDDGTIFEDYLEGGFLIEPMLGVNFNLNKFFIDIGIGYRLQTSTYVSYAYYPEYYDEPEEEVTERYPFNLHQFNLKLGAGYYF